MVSSIRSLPTLANHALNGSAFGDGTDCIIRNSCSVLSTSVLYLFPSEDGIFSCTIFSYNSTAPSFFNFRFKSLQYRRGFSVEVKTEITSTIEKYHSSCSSSHAVRFFLSSSQIPRCKHRGIWPSRQSPNGHASMSAWLVARGNNWIASLFLNSPIVMYLSFTGMVFVYCILLKKTTFGAAIHLVPAFADRGVQGRVQREVGGPKPPPSSE